MAHPLERLQPLGLLVLRLMLGVVMARHGFLKIAHPGQTAALMQSYGMPGWTAYLPMAAEFGGGILLLAGLLTRVAALAILVEQVVSIVKAHGKAGLVGSNGIELPLALAAIAFALICFGAGPFALDRKLGKGGGGRRSAVPAR